MNLDLKIKKYNADDCCVIFNKLTPFFGFSNMSGGYPLWVNGKKIYSSEGLYQSCGFPQYPSIQERIIKQTSGLYSKMVRRKYEFDMRPDWSSVKTDIMYWCLRIKLCQNWDKVGRLFDMTDGRTIVEKSRKDNFWGAIPDEKDNNVLYGRNVLGQLWMTLRDEYYSKSKGELMVVEPLNIPDFLLFGEPIRVVYGQNP